MKMTISHTRAALAVIALCASGLLITLLSGNRVGTPLPPQLDAALMAVLGVGGVAAPVLGLLTRWSDPARLSATALFAVPLFSLALFLSPQFDVFPARILCVVALVLAFAGTVVALFSALDARSPRSRSVPSRFR